MARSFSIPRSLFGATSDATLRDEVRAHTGTDDEASSILRCIERLGRDPSIREYEMTPRTSRRTNREAQAMAWSVRAIRA